jgi:NAD(P)-dependent dehydrogenase (short-subunit alcohol dehydrogenase family)
MQLGLDGLRVLVTAGATGIGQAIAQSFLEEGARVHICDIDDGALASAINRTGITGTLADVSDRAQVLKLFDDALGILGGLDVLINNAGISGPLARVEVIHPEDWDRVMAVNLTGQFNCARLAIPHLMKSANASIVNMSSAAGRLGQASKAPYVASKWGVIGFTKTLAIELGPMGIRVNAILPGIVSGDRLERVMVSRSSVSGQTIEKAREKLLSMVSLGKAVPPQLVADQILFLCSSHGALTSGQSIPICGDLQAIL